MKQLPKNRHDPHESYANNDANGYHRGGCTMNAETTNQTSTSKNELIEQVYDAIMKLSEEDRKAILKKYAARNGWNTDKL